MPASIKLYGIKNCDTMKKARDWLDQRGIAYAFHDYREARLTKATLADWARRVGWEILLNRASTTFRELDETSKTNIDEAKALRLMLAQPTMIKRPVLDRGDALLVGFKPDNYEKAFAAGR